MPRWIGRHDNNVAEYAALLEALSGAPVEVKAKSLRVYLDSEVVVKQMTGEYTCQSPRLDYDPIGFAANWRAP